MWFCVFGRTLCEQLCPCGLGEHLHGLRSSEQRHPWPMGSYGGDREFEDASPSSRMFLRLPPYSCGGQPRGAATPLWWATLPCVVGNLALWTGSPNMPYLEFDFGCTLCEQLCPCGLGELLHGWRSSEQEASLAHGILWWGSQVRGRFSEFEDVSPITTVLHVVGSSRCSNSVVVGSPALWTASRCSGSAVADSFACVENFAVQQLRCGGQLCLCRQLRCAA